MAARKLKQVESIVNQQANQAAQASQPAAQPNLVALSAAVWETVGKVAEKESRRDDVPDGFSSKVELHISAKIDGQIYRQTYSADLSVGHRTETAVSHTPGGDKRLIAYVLGKLNAATREAILRDIPAEYAAAELPPVNEAVMGAVEGLLTKLRAGKRQEKRGNVSVKYQPAAVALGLVG